MLSFFVTQQTMTPSLVLVIFPFHNGPLYIAGLLRFLTETSTDALQFQPLDLCIHSEVSGY